MTDKERILMQIIREFYFTQCLGPGIKPWDSEAYKRDGGGYYAHFVRWIRHEQLKPGDLVFVGAGGREVNPWTVGFIDQVLEYGRCMIREIGTGEVCDYSNAEFIPILGLHSTQLLEGDRFKFYQNVLEAFREGDELDYRYGGLEFEGDEAIVWVRAYHDGLLHWKHGAKPFLVRVKWHGNTTSVMTPAEILDALRAGGYSTRKYEPYDLADLEGIKDFSI